MSFSNMKSLSSLERNRIALNILTNIKKKEDQENASRFVIRGRKNSQSSSGAPDDH